MQVFCISPSSGDALIWFLISISLKNFMIGVITTATPTPSPQSLDPFFVPNQQGHHTSVTQVCVWACLREAAPLSPFTPARPCPCPGGAYSHTHSSQTTFPLLRKEPRETPLAINPGWVCSMHWKQSIYSDSKNTESEEALRSQLCLLWLRLYKWEDEEHQLKEKLKQ